MNPSLKGKKKKFILQKYTVVGSLRILFCKIFSINDNFMIINRMFYIKANNMIDPLIRKCHMLFLTDINHFDTVFQFIM